MIEQQIIEQVLDQTDIVEVIGTYVELKKKGTNWEACCPFHSEKTPSFKVSPSKGIWTCFGACQESGNVISFVMKMDGLTFPEAVRKLAARLGIAVDDRQPTPEQLKAQHHRESMLTAVELARAWFVRRMADNGAGKAAAAYAAGRWGADFTARYGIGYAPADGQAFVDWAVESKLDTALLEEAGLIAPSKNGGYYTVFRDRLMIPIRDRTGRTVGFTARYLGHDDGVPKYINSKDSVIYRKGESVFGIDWAKRTATRQGKFYLVEGGPDVLKMQSLDIDNTVASLGTAWTDKQFAQLRKLAPAVCFVPDSDPPAEGKPWGTGIDKVLKNGAAAVAAGLAVTVKEIPLGEGNTKADPDSWITNKSRFRELEEEDFIVWFARKRFAADGGSEGRTATVKEVARMVARIGDTVKEQMYLSELNRVYRNKSLWAQAINEQKKELTDATDGGDVKLSRKALAQYGFFEQGNCYYALTEKGQQRWSNFVLLPLFHIKDPIAAKRLFVARNYEGREVFVEMKQEDLVNMARFQTVLESAGNFIWEAGGKELTKLKAFLYEKTQTAEEITQFGWHAEGFYAYGNGLLKDGTFYEGNEYGIIHLPEGDNYYIPALSKLYAKDRSLFTFERQFIAVKTQDISVADYFAQIARVYGDTGKVAIAFVIATCFRDIIVRKTRFFPILDIFGPKGTGKSELALALMSLFQTRSTLTFLTNSSRPALAETVAQVANAPVHLEEYKNSIGFEKIEFLKGIWDGQGRSRMNMDRDKKKETSKVDSGVIITGQEIPTADIALFSRLIFLMLNKTTFSAAERAEFDKLRRMKEKGVTYLSTQILNQRPIFEQDYVANYNAVCSELYEALRGEYIEDRMLNNWAVAVAAARTIEGKVKLPFSIAELTAIAMRGIIEQNKFCQQNNDTANFWNIVAYLQQDGYIYNEADYKIRTVTQLSTTDKGRRIDFEKPRDVLLLRKSRVIALYRKYGAQVGDNILPTPTIESYLKYSAEYLGRKQSERFKMIQQGREVTERVETEGGTLYSSATTVDQALCFDYAAIVATYGINLKVDV